MIGKYIVSQYLSLDTLKSMFHYNEESKLSQVQVDCPSLFWQIDKTNRFKCYPTLTRHEVGAEMH